MRRRLAAIAAALLAAGTIVVAAPTAAHADGTRDKQWYLDSLGVNAAHKYSQGAGITIGVIDSGIDATHPDLKGNIKAGKDYGTSKDNGLHDSDTENDGHGTRVASVLVGHGHGTHHSDGVMGIAPKAKIISVGVGCDKACPSDEGDGIGKAIRWLADKKVDIISVSMGGTPDAGRAVKYATDKGVHVVASAGNDSADYGGVIGVHKETGTAWPANADGAIPVTGTTQNGGFWAHSLTLSEASPQPRLGISAPATDIPTASKGNGYKTVSGTSASAPIVAGTLALIMAAYPKLNFDKVEERLLYTVDDKGPKDFDDKYGWGIVNPLHALTKKVKHYGGAISTKADMVPLDQQGKGGKKHGGTSGPDSSDSAGNHTALTGESSRPPLFPIGLTAAGIMLIAAVVVVALVRRKRRRSTAVPPQRLLTGRNPSNMENDGPGGSGGHGVTPPSPPESNLRQLAEKLKTAATEAWIREQDGDHRVMMVDTVAGAKSLAHEQAADGTWDIVKTYGDRYLVGHKTDIAKDPNSFMWAIWARDSEAYQGILDSFEGLKEQVEWFDTLKPSKLEHPIHELRTKVVKGLDQGGLVDNADDIAKAVARASTNSGKGGNTAAAIFESKSEWGHIADVSRSLTDFNGYAAETFRLAYADRLPGILLGQYAVALVLVDTLEAVKHAFEGAKQDAADLAKRAIDSFEAHGSGTGINWKKTLDTVARVGKAVSGIAGKIPYPGAQALSKVAGFVSTGASVGSSVVAYFEKDSGEKEPKIELQTVGAQAKADECSDMLSKIQDTLDGIERGAEKLVDDFYNLVTSTAYGDSFLPSFGGGKEVTLTVRQAFFEPLAPRSTKAHGPGLADIGKKVGDKDSGNDPTSSTITGNDVMGESSVHGQHFGGDLERLYKVGHTYLPDLASKYSELAGSLGGGKGLESAFSREVDVAGGAQTDFGTGPFYPSWIALHDELKDIFSNSATNLNLVGAALVYAAQDFTEHDEAAAQAFRDNWPGNKLPWE